MANHPSRNKPSRDALEMIAHFARHGIALKREQQEAVIAICHVSRKHAALQLERCNGDWPIRRVDQDAWRAQIDSQEAHAENLIRRYAAMLPNVQAVQFSYNPVGGEVQLIMIPEWRRLHDSFGGDAYCVPGS